MSKYLKDILINLHENRINQPSNWRVDTWEQFYSELTKQGANNLTGRILNLDYMFVASIGWYLHFNNINKILIGANGISYDPYFFKFIGIDCTVIDYSHIANEFTKSLEHIVIHENCLSRFYSNGKYFFTPMQYKKFFSNKTIKDGKIDYITADLGSMPFSNNIFPVIYISNGLAGYNFKQKEVILNEINRILQPGGLLIMVFIDNYGTQIRDIDSLLINCGYNISPFTIIEFKSEDSFFGIEQLIIKKDSSKKNAIYRWATG